MLLPELREVGAHGSEGLSECIELISWQHGTVPQERTGIGYGKQFALQLGPAGLQPSAPGLAPPGSPQPDPQAGRAWASSGMAGTE